MYLTTKKYPFHEFEKTQNTTCCTTMNKPFYEKIDYAI